MPPCKDKACHELALQCAIINFMLVVSKLYSIETQIQHHPRFNAVFCLNPCKHRTVVLSTVIVSSTRLLFLARQIALIIHHSSREQQTDLVTFTNIRIPLGQPLSFDIHSNCTHAATPHSQRCGQVKGHPYRHIPFACNVHHFA